MSRELERSLAILADQLAGAVEQYEPLRRALNRLVAAILKPSEFTAESAGSESSVADTPAETLSPPIQATQAADQPAPGFAPASALETTAPAGPPPIVLPSSKLVPRPAPLAPPSRRQTPVSTEPLPPLLLGQGPPRDDSTSSLDYSRFTQRELDLDLIEQRCRMKAAGARWADKRNQLLAAKANFAAEIEPHDREIIAQAKMIPDCYLWMCTPDSPNPEDSRLYENLAGSFEAAGDAVALARQLEEDDEGPDENYAPALYLMAEAQSALRKALYDFGDANDFDQGNIFRWLRNATTEHGVYISRYMRMNDPADPANYSDLRNRIAEIADKLESGRSRGRQRKKLLGKVKHKIAQICANPETAREEWPRVVESVDALVADGVPTSNRELRDMLLPAIEHLPDLGEVPENFDRVLKEIDRFLQTTPQEEPAPVKRLSAQVAEVRERLQGRAIVFIGGVRYTKSAKAIEEAFGLSELIWIETRAHESVAPFEPYVARPDVALVVLLIRFSSHAYGDVQDFCQKYDKPLVRLPGGYNPNQVAAMILDQCSERLVTT